MTARYAVAMPCPAASSNGHAQFVAAAGTHSYHLQGEEVALRQHPDVFPPSAFGLNFAERVDFSDASARPISAPAPPPRRCALPTATPAC